MKKGIMMSTLVLIILVSVSILALSGLVYQASVGINEGKKIDQCKLSVIKASSQNLVSGVASVLNCPRIYTKIEKKDVEKKGNIDDQKIRKALADELVNCWGKMGKGSAAGFNDNVLKSTKGRFYNAAEDYTCVICSTLEYDKDIQETLKKDSGKYTVDGFMRFLDEETIGESSGEKYIDYLSMKKSVARSSGFFAVSQVEGTGDLSVIDEIDTSKSYHIFYVVYGGDYITTKATNIVDYLQNFFGFTTDLGIFEKDEAYGSIHVVTGENIGNVKCKGGLLN